MSKWLGGWCWLCFVGLGGVSSVVANEPPRPNIVFVMADDLGWGDVGWHGGNVATPHWDALAERSRELTQHYVAPVCSPTRTGLLTGRCWSRFGVTTPQNQRALPWETVTLTTALGATGYQTALIGKWHLGSLPSAGPQRFGFDHSYGSLAGGVSPWNHRYKQGPFSQTWHRNGEWVEESGHVTDLLAAEAVRWIEARDEQPFFLYVPFTAVHLPVKEPAAWVARVPETIRGDVPRHYAASILHLDDAVGRILEALTRKSLRDNTLFVFTSDNGGSTAENNDPQYPADDCPDGRLPGNNLPLRGQKGELYEGGTRVPTLVSWPNRISPGRTATPTAIIDWLPTFAALAGYRPETDLSWDGVDLSGLLTRDKPLAPRPLYAVGPSGKSRSLRSGDWKLIVTGELSRPDRLQLFRIDIDPSERTDLASTEAGETARLLDAMRQAALRDNDAKVD
jgi:arylsulfatase A-like enzyme